MRKSIPQPNTSELNHCNEISGSKIPAYFLYIMNIMKPDLLIASMKFVFPEYVIYKNGIFLQTLFDKDSCDVLLESSQCLEEVEFSINQIHIRKIFSFGSTLGKDNIAFIGDMIVICWEHVLKYTFPERTFEVWGYFEDNSYMADYVICFFQTKPSRMISNAALFREPTSYTIMPSANMSDLKDVLLHNAPDQSVDLFDYAVSNLTCDLTISFFKILWPDFIVYENGVFFKEGFDVNSYNEWHREFKGNLNKIESMINHHHLEIMFVLENLGSKNVLLVGEILKFFWNCSLHYTFPHRKFELKSWFEDEANETDFVITFYQV